MKKNINLLNRAFDNLLLHPFLFAVYPVLFMYSYNIREVSPVHVVIPVMIMATAAYIFEKGFFWLLRNKEKAALVSTVFFFIFFAYSHIYDALVIVNFMAGFRIIRHLFMVPVFIASWVFISFRVALTKKNIMVINKILNFTSVILISVNLLNIIAFETGKFVSPGLPRNGKQVKDVSDRLLSVEGKPDIYYIILDEYAGFKAIKKYYDYDNS